MVIKRGIAEDVYDIALQHLNDMVKAKLPEFQSSVVVRHTRRGGALEKCLHKRRQLAGCLPYVTYGSVGA